MGALIDSILERCRKQLGSSHPETHQLRESCLTFVVGDEDATSELESACDVQHVESARTQARRVRTAQLRRALESSPPWHINQGKPTLPQVRGHVGECPFRDRRRDVAAKHCQLDAVDDFRFAMKRQRQRAAQSGDPRAEGARPRVVDIEASKCARIPSTRAMPPCIW